MSSDDDGYNCTCKKAVLTILSLFLFPISVIFCISINLFNALYHYLEKKTLISACCVDGCKMCYDCCDKFEDLLISGMGPSTDLSEFVYEELEWKHFKISHRQLTKMLGDVLLYVMFHQFVEVNIDCKGWESIVELFGYFSFEKDDPDRKIYLIFPNVNYRYIKFEDVFIPKEIRSMNFSSYNLDLNSEGNVSKVLQLSHLHSLGELRFDRRITYDSPKNKKEIETEEIVIEELSDEDGGRVTSVPKDGIIPLIPVLKKLKSLAISIHENFEGYLNVFNELKEVRYLSLALQHDLSGIEKVVFPNLVSLKLEVGVEEDGEPTQNQEAIGKFLSKHISKLRKLTIDSNSWLTDNVPLFPKEWMRLICEKGGSLNTLDLWYFRWTSLDQFEGLMKSTTWEHRISGMKIAFSVGYGENHYKKSVGVCKQFKKIVKKNKQLGIQVESVY